MTSPAIRPPLLSAFDVAVAQLLGEPLPPLPEIAGRYHPLADSPLSPAELNEITDPSELRRVIGTRAAARHLAERSSACSRRA